MNRLAVAGGWYGEALVSGDYAVLMVDSHLQTSQGLAPLPGENVLYLRATNAGGGFGVCGVGGGSDTALLWRDGWTAHGLAHGVSACIFDNDGVLHVATPAQGSQGYRYCAEDGSLVTGDDTYNSATPFAVVHGVTDLWEWTQRADLTIGQNSKDECIIVGPAGRRVLEGGQCRFIRFNRVGDSLAVAMWKPLENCAVLHWLTSADISTLPLESTTPVEPPIDPPIDPPDPEIPVRLPDDVYATLVALRPKYPTPLVDKGAELLNEVAWTHRAQGYGLERKDGGANCGCPGISVRMGCDILRTATLGWDVLQDAEGAGNPVQSDSGPAEPSRFVAPVTPDGIVVPPVEPPVEPPTDPALEQRVTALEVKVAAQQVQLTEQKQQLAAQATALEILDDRVTVLEAGTPPPSTDVIHLTNAGMTGTFTGTITRTA